jgi:hypothetical protein
MVRVVAVLGRLGLEGTLLSAELSILPTSLSMPWWGRRGTSMRHTAMLLCEAVVGEGLGLDEGLGRVSLRVGKGALLCSGATSESSF